MSAAGKIVNDLTSEALATLGRIRTDVDHLKAIGERAKTVGKVAAKAAHQTFTAAVERAADHLLDAERVFRGMRDIPADARPRGRRS